MSRNCFFFAFRLWIKSRFRLAFAVRRSEGLGGKVPHFFVIAEDGRDLTITDYVPRKRKVTWMSPGDFVMHFDGDVRVRRYRLVSVKKNDEDTQPAPLL